MSPLAGAADPSRNAFAPGEVGSPAEDSSFDCSTLFGSGFGLITRYKIRSRCVASITVLILKLRKPGALASSVYFPAAKAVNNVSPSVSEGVPTTSYPSLGIRLISAAPRNWLLSSNRSLTLRLEPTAVVVGFVAGLLEELDCWIGGEGVSVLRSCAAAGRTITAVSVTRHSRKTNTHFRASCMASALPFLHTVRHGPFHAKFPVDCPNRPQTLGLSAIRPGYTSAIIRKSIASPNFCQVNIPEDPQPSVWGRASIACPSGQITLRHTSTPVALTP